MALRILIAAAAASVLAWSGFWFFFSGVHRSAVENLASGLRSQGKFADYADIRVQGFPNRFDTTVRQPAYFDPDSGFSWNAEFFQILSLSYQPHRMILAWPRRQTIAVAGEQIEIQSDKMRASLSLQGISKPDLSAFIAESGPLRLAGSSGWQSRFSEALLAVRRIGDAGDKIEFGARAAHLPDVFEGAEPGGWLDSLLSGFSSLEIALILDFDGPYSRELCAAGRTHLENIRISESSLRWKDGRLAVSGQLAVSGGRVSGTVTIDPGRPGFAALASKFPEESGMFPFSRRNMKAAALLLDTFSRGPIETRLRDGKLFYRDMPLLAVPEIRICPAA